MTIRVITDSTSDLPSELASAHNILVLPAHIHVGERSYRDGVNLTRQQFYQQLPDFSTHPTTSVPAPGEFADAYRACSKEGYPQILSIHIASELSGMLNAARLGAEMVPEASVTIFDSGQLSMGLGLLALMVAEAIQKGKEMAELCAHLDQLAAHTHTFAALATLEYLRRSGRVNWAQFGVGTLLKIKPILHVHRGKIGFERVRTQSRANEFLRQQLAAHAPFKRLAVLHTANKASAENFREEAQRYSLSKEKPMIAGVTPTIGVHVGPGGLGFAGIASH